MVNEASMIDDSNWLIVKDQLPSVGAACPQLVADMHLKETTLRNDFKQLPPASSNPQFLTSDPAIFEVFIFCVLRQNRRLANSETPEEQRQLHAFHAVLEDVAHGRPTDAVRPALIDA